jgi:hypothetical protein
MCEHIWLVTSWKLSTHSKSAQELMCQKCLCTVDYEGLNTLRCHPKHKVKEPVPRGTEDANI